MLSLVLVCLCKALEMHNEGTKERAALKEQYDGDDLVTLSWFLLFKPLLKVNSTQMKLLRFLSGIANISTHS